MRLLDPIKDRPTEYEPIEDAISKLFVSEIYLPLIKLASLPNDTLKNSNDDSPLKDAILSGRIVHYRGEFNGRFSAAVSRELKKIGAVWDRRQRTFKVPLSKLPREIQGAVRLADDRFKRVLKTIDNMLADMLPDEIASKLSLEDKFDGAIFRMEKDLSKIIKSVSVPAKLTEERVRTISTEYTNNMKLDIKDWTQREIKTLREKVQKSAFQGNRYESLIQTIKRSHQVSKSKAKFLARQETNLLLSTYTKGRMLEAGLPEYQWKCVHASPLHPVRPMHKALDGRIFRWDDPPIVNEKGERKNPGQDYGCRCFARPVVRF